MAYWRHAQHFFPHRYQCLACTSPPSSVCSSSLGWNLDEPELTEAYKTLDKDKVRGGMQQALMCRFRLIVVDRIRMGYGMTQDCVHAMLDKDRSMPSSGLAWHEMCY